MIGKHAPGIEALKWFAVVLMVGDHINAALFDHTLPMLSEAARVVMPIFALVLGYNMARERASYEVKVRTLKRLLTWALIATPFHAIAFNSALPLNVLFTFAIAVGAMLLGTQGYRLAAVALVLFASILVDYMWAGVFLTLSAWWFFRTRSLKAEIALGVSFGLICAYNHSWWPLLAIPLLIIGSRVNVDIARDRRAFYVFYPAHLAVLAVVRFMM